MKFHISIYLLLTITSVLQVGNISVSAQTVPNCATISVTGPAGIIEAGDSMIFTLTVEGGSTDKIDYEWDVSSGTIVSGQGTPSITVQTDRSLAGSKVRASAHVKGLSAGCPSTISETGQIQCGGDPPLIDEYGELTQPAEMRRLSAILAEMRSEPRWRDWSIYIIEYPRKTTSDRLRKSRQTWIERYFAARRIPPQRLQIVSGGASHTGRRRTKLYLMPPDGYCG